MLSSVGKSLAAATTTHSSAFATTNLQQKTDQSSLTSTTTTADVTETREPLVDRRHPCFESSTILNLKKSEIIASILQQRNTRTMLQLHTKKLLVEH